MCFRFPHAPELDCNVHIFKAADFDGEPQETEEMRPGWFHVDEIPFKDMWPDDEYWMPMFLEDKIFKGRECEI